MKKFNSLNRKFQYYIIRVLTGKEKKYIAWISKSLFVDDVRIIWPRRCLSIRRSGIIKDQESSLYPGYLFLETQQLSDQAIMVLKKAPGFVKFLKSNDNIIPLNNHDRDRFLELISYGEIIRKSQVVFDENNRIRVLEGPLKQLEGDIVKVDRRKGRAKVRLHLNELSLLFDLGFDVMEIIPEKIE